MQKYIDLERIHILEEKQKPIRTRADDQVVVKNFYFSIFYHGFNS